MTRYTAVLLLMAAAATMGQTPKPDITYANVLTFSDVPKNAHDYAISRIKVYQDYIKTKLVGSTFKLLYINGFASEPQSVGLDKDGNLELINISAEDALLMLTSSETDRALENQKRWDREEAARKDIPPAQIKFKGTRYKMENLPDWSNGQSLGNTNCGLARIHILETNPAKKSTVMHEAMHVVTGCNDDPRLHAAITAIAPGLVKLLQENPDLVKYLVTQGERR